MSQESKASINENIIELFNDAQRTRATHQKCAVLMKKLLEETKEDLFLEAFEDCIKRVLCKDFKESNPYVERIIEFIALFCSMLKPEETEENFDETQDFKEHPVLTKIFDFLLIAQRNYLDVVRFRACQIINKILNDLVGTEVSNGLCEKIEENLKERLKDPKRVIRLQGVIALHRLQDPTNPDDEIIAELLNLLTGDPFAKVRQLCVEKIAGRIDTVSKIVTRTRDVDLNVRLAAFKRLSKVPHLLRISDRQLIIHCGFVESSEKVKAFFKDLFLPAWIDHYGNILLFLKAVRLDADENDIKETTRLVELILLSYFRTNPLTELTKNIPINEDRLIPVDQLDWEVVNYWRIYVQYLNSREEFEEELNRVVPELVHFCRYIKNYQQSCPADLTAHEFLQHQFVLKQLFLITKTFDFGDTSGRQALNTLVYKILVKEVLTTSVVEVIVSNLEHTITNPERRSHFVNEIISEIIYPMNEDDAQKNEIDRHYKMSQLKVQLHDLTHQQEKAIINENFFEAGELKKRIDEAQLELTCLVTKQSEPEQMEKRTDVPTIIKYLDIAAGLLVSPQIRQLTPSLQTLQNDVIQEMLMHDNDTVRAKALRAYGLCCIVDKQSAKYGIHIFSTPILAYQAGEECDTQTLLICIGAVVDLLRIYGTQLMAEPVEDQMSESTDEEHVKIFTGGTSLTNLIQGLVDLMDDETMEIQAAAGRALCCLIYSERVYSSSLISRLIIKWCNPASESEPEIDYLKQLIGFTLAKIPTLNEHVDQLGAAVLLTVKTLTYAPKVSPLADVNIENIVKFMLALCRTSMQGEQIHANLAMTICHNIIQKPKSKMTVIYSKILCMLDIPKDKLKIKELLQLSDEIRDEVDNRICLANIVKYISLLTQKCAQYEVLETKNSTDCNSLPNI